MLGQKIGSEVTSQPLGRKSKVKTRGTEVSDHKLDVRGIREERPRVRGQRGQRSERSEVGGPTSKVKKV